MDSASIEVEPPYPERSRLIWPVAVFFLANIVAVLDSKILTMLVDPLRKELHITDVQISLLEGAAFSVCYLIVSIPIGLLVDQYSRKRLAIAGVLCWSIATAICGFTSDFRAMFLCRIFTGLGEAVLFPVTISTICDLAPPERRGLPLTFLLMGTSLGRGATVLIVGSILALAGASQLISTPWGSQIAPWRAAFIICGALGFVVSALLATIREPTRRLTRAQMSEPWDLRAKLAYIVKNARVLLPFMLCLSVISVGNFGLAAWGPSLLIRHFGLSAPEVGAYLGPALIGASCLGALLGGYLSDRASSWGGPRARILLIAVSGLGLLPGAFAVFAPNATIAIVLITLSTASFLTTAAAHSTATQDLFPTPMRGTAASLVNTTVILVGSASGPLMIAVMTEHLFRDPAQVGYSMAAAIVPTVILGFILAIIARHALQGQNGGTNAGAALLESEAFGEA